MLLIKKWLPKIVIVVAIIAICSVLFEKCSSNANHKAFLVEMDSLHKVNDSLFAEIKKDDAVIDSLNYVSEELTYKVEHQKAKVIRIVETVEVEKLPSGIPYWMNSTSSPRTNTSMWRDFF